jgi:histidinol dehydrogenase
VPLRLDVGQANFEEGFAALLTSRRTVTERADAAAAEIVADVRTRGDAAVLEYTARFDRHRLSARELRVADRDIDAALERAPRATREALELCAVRIADYHARLRPRDFSYRDDAGVELGARWTPLDSVGVYVPGGTAAYPSSVLMNAIPARVAGVGSVVMVVPAPGGTLNDLVLAAARIAGVHAIFRIGGAQAVAALAYGTESVPRVDKIVGPGNAYVAAAKKRVFGDVGIDLVAGPSEVLVIADSQNDPEWIAADLLAQAEHDEAAQAILITDDPAFAERTAAAVERQLKRMLRGAVAGASWSRHGALIVVRNMDDAAALADRIAPEHLELAVAAPAPLARRIRHAGAIFLGRHAPEAIGDYVAGPSHVLPTAGSARFSSGLGVLDFMKRTSLIGCDAEALSAVGGAALAMARAEGLDAHAHSLEVRLGRD